MISGSVACEDESKARTLSFGAYNCRLSSCCFGLVVFSQLLLLAFVHRANNGMRKEWPRIMKGGIGDARITVLDTDFFDGPTHAFYPRQCDVIESWQKLMAEVRHGISAGLLPVFENPGKTPEQLNSSRQIENDISELLPTAPTTTAATTAATTETAPSASASGLLANRSAANDTGTNGSVPTATTATTNPSWESPSVSKSDAPDGSRKLFVNGAKSFDTITAMMLERGEHITVNICGVERHLRGPGFWNRYFSMITLTNRLHTLTEDRFRSDSIDAVARNRDMVRWVAPPLFFVCFIVKYSMKLIDIWAHRQGYRYVQLWNNGRTTADKIIESLLLHVTSIIYTLALQMSYCTLYLTFWRHDHFIMQYIPIGGLGVTWMILLILVAVMTMDRVKGWMVGASTRAVLVFWISLLLVFAFFFVPMIGYSITSVTFMWRLKVAGWIEEEVILSEDFVFHANRAANCALAFMLIAVVDVYTIISIDLDNN